MRKFLLSMVVTVAAAGLTLADPVKFVKYDEKTKELTVKAGKKGSETETKYTLTDAVKFFDADKKEVKREDALKKFAGKKPVKAFDLKLAGDKIEEVKFTETKKAKKAKAAK